MFFPKVNPQPRRGTSRVLEMGVWAPAAPAQWCRVGHDPRVVGVETPVFFPVHRVWSEPNFDPDHRPVKPQENVVFVVVVPAVVRPRVDQTKVIAYPERYVLVRLEFDPG